MAKNIGLIAWAACGAALICSAAVAAEPSAVGKAGPQAEDFKSVLDYLLAGGWVEIAILIISVIAFVAIVDCWLRTRLGAAVPPKFLAEVRRRLAADGPADAATYCAGHHALVAEALRVGLRRSREGLLTMEAGAFQALEEGLASLHARLIWPLAAAVISPLMGLFGAVISLVWIFALMLTPSPPAGGDVARGVVASLVPLATGLLVSVIVTLFYFALRRRIARIGVAASAPVREILEQGAMTRKDQA
jgi:biopolymer transport protein ExbB/TolQ